MFNLYKISSQIDIIYTFNSFIYVLKHTPLIRKLIPRNIYKSEKFKNIIVIIGILIMFIKNIFYKLLYIFILYYVSYYLIPAKQFSTLFLIATILGIFINNKILSATSSNYYSVILMNMEARKYFFTNLFKTIIKAFIYNFLALLIVSPLVKLSLSNIFLLTMLATISRVVGETFNVYYYKRNNNLLINNNKVYFTLVFTFILIALLPYLKIYLSINIIIIILIILFILIFICFKYLLKTNNYKLMYKRLNTKNNVYMDNNLTTTNYLRVKDKDKEIADAKLIGKNGYDYFNTIFFERHKSILLNSMIRFSYVITFIFIAIMIFMIIDPSYNLKINKFLTNNLSFFLFVMYFLNRGATITQAMFYNCDRSMLTFNFYKEPKVILNLVKKRVTTLIKINLIPSLLMAIFIPIVLYTSGGSSMITYFSIFFSIITMSVFFSVHYLVLYYLLQPYNTAMQMRSASYSIASMITYFVCYYVSRYTINTNLFAICLIVITIMYLIIALNLVYYKAKDTFKLK